MVIPFGTLQVHSPLFQHLVMHVSAMPSCPCGCCRSC